MSNNFSVRQILKTGGSFFVGASIAIGILCPKVLAKSTPQLVTAWKIDVSNSTNDTETTETLSFYNDGTYTSAVEITTRPGGIYDYCATFSYRNTNGNFSITGNKITFKPLTLSVTDYEGCGFSISQIAPTETYNEHGEYIVESFSEPSNEQTLTLNQVGGNINTISQGTYQRSN
ncbi:MAG: hypothetical protein HWQ38_22350 [Nostoc sp. NMS7]|uniref:hypothetical protein n=1 Tax=Nostoc sp. NMS7 TaxID=2815391 RepID=UPI0025D50C57|nr:hypothetical protein [Nostoc sp. NMS7]MBN3949056.1 hypothetical protein [Nostoc sp. NMS7]